MAGVQVIDARYRLVAEEDVVRDAAPVVGCLAIRAQLGAREYVPRGAPPGLEVDDRFPVERYRRD